MAALHNRPFAETSCSFDTEVPLALDGRKCALEQAARTVQRDVWIRLVVQFLAPAPRLHRYAKTRTQTFDLYRRRALKHMEDSDK